MPRPTVFIEWSERAGWVAYCGDSLNRCVIVANCRGAALERILGWAGARSVTFLPARASVQVFPLAARASPGTASSRGKTAHVDRRSGPWPVPDPSRHRRARSGRDAPLLAAAGAPLLPVPGGKLRYPKPPRGRGAAYRDDQDRPAETGLATPFDLLARGGSKCPTTTLMSSPSRRATF